MAHVPDEADDDSPSPLPWEQTGRVRRDCLPHRAPLLQFLGLLTMALGLMSCCIFPTLIGVPLALTVSYLARHDVKEMSVGGRDPAGLVQTLQAHDWALIGLGFCLVGWIIPLLFFLATLG